MESRRRRTWMPRFACRHRRDGHQANPSSPPSLIATPGPPAARSRRLRFTPAARGETDDVATQRSAPHLRCSWLAALSGFCCGPRWVAIWRPFPVAISRRLAVLATKSFARRARRRWFRFEFLESRPIAGATILSVAPFLAPSIPNSEFRIRPVPVSVSVSVSVPGRPPSHASRVRGPRR